MAEDRKEIFRDYRRRKAAYSPSPWRGEVLFSFGMRLRAFVVIGLFIYVLGVFLWFLIPFMNRLLIEHFFSQV